MSDRRGLLASLGLLLLRLGAGGLLAFGHGWAKLADFGAKSAKFSDPLGLGSGASLALATFAELFCSLAVMAGLLTRLAAIPPLVTMLVAAFVVHAADPFPKKELPLLYALSFAVLIFTGPGRFSLDAVLASVWRRKRRSRPEGARP